ncbi:MAG TPA: twin-arginine translocase subunit TatC, partial [Opitutus sp.]|nr:twin-arginine translocase subunit TatC [Opitutus sp.]
MSDIDALPDDDTGVKKSFWDHLKDLRTALLRSTIAIGLAVILCLLIADKLVMILEYPLQRIDIFQSPKPTVTFKIGDTQLGPYQVTPEQFSGLAEGETPQIVYEIGVSEIAGQQVATLKPLPPVQGEKGASLRVRLLNLSPTEAFFVAFRVAIYGGVIVAAPFWIYFMGQFFLPALNMRERSVLYQWVVWGFLLFLTGVAMTYFALLPLALHASVEYSHLMGFEAYDWRAESYIGFVTKFIVGMGVGFQFPIVVLLMVKMGLLTHEQLGHYRRHVVVLSLVLGAL